MPETQDTSALHQLWNRLHAVAMKRGWEWRESARGLGERLYPAEAILGVEGIRAGQAEEDRDARVVLISNTYIVRVIALKEPPVDESESLAQANLQASIDAAYFPRAADDVHVYFVAERRAGDDPEAWARFAELVERDDRVCRKLMWIPPRGDIDLRARSVEAFLRRTFFASPWEGAKSGAPQEIDPIERALGAIDLDGLPDRSLLREWVSAFSTGDDATIIATILQVDEP